MRPLEPRAAHIGTKPSPEGKDRPEPTAKSPLGWLSCVLLLTCACSVAHRKRCSTGKLSAWRWSSSHRSHPNPITLTLTLTLPRQGRDDEAVMIEIRDARRMDQAWTRGCLPAPPSSFLPPSLPRCAWSPERTRRARVSHDRAPLCKVQ